jgi:arginine repressor
MGTQKNKLIFLQQETKKNMKTETDKYTKLAELDDLATRQTIAIKAQIGEEIHRICMLTKWTSSRVIREYRAIRGEDAKSESYYYGACQMDQLFSKKQLNVLMENLVPMDCVQALIVKKNYSQAERSATLRDIAAKKIKAPWTRIKGGDAYLRIHVDECNRKRGRPSEDVQLRGSNNPDWVSTQVCNKGEPIEDALVNVQSRIFTEAQKINAVRSVLNQAAQKCGLTGIVTGGC